MKTKNKKSRYVVEDRSKRDPKYSFGGKWLVMETRSKPFPHFVFAGMFDSLEEAEEARKKLEEKS